MRVTSGSIDQPKQPWVKVRHMPRNFCDANLNYAFAIECALGFRDQDSGPGSLSSFRGSANGRASRRAPLGLLDSPNVDPSWLVLLGYTQ